MAESDTREYQCQSENHGWRAQVVIRVLPKCCELGPVSKGVTTKANLAAARSGRGERRGERGG